MIWKVNSILTKQSQHKQFPSPSSWKKLESESKSTSFPAVVNTRNPFLTTTPFKESHDDPTPGTEDGSVKSWAKALRSLAQTTMSSSSPKTINRDGIYRKMAELDLESVRSPRRRPVLTITLIKLRDVFETICRHLTDRPNIPQRASCVLVIGFDVGSSLSENFGTQFTCYEYWFSRLV